eukprot:UN09912
MAMISWRKLLCSARMAILPYDCQFSICGTIFTFCNASFGF